MYFPPKLSCMSWRLTHKNRWNFSIQYVNYVYLFHFHSFESGHYSVILACKSDLHLSSFLVESLNVLKSSFTVSNENEPNFIVFNYKDRWWSCFQLITCHYVSWPNSTMFSICFGFCEHSRIATCSESFLILARHIHRVFV